mmetsp:Transcript_22773/g.21975  ORF Transcript_22773/g.21975 Transcript_22773/m.21975 type:complete len:228 (-) Transcript_22773:1242-1925(-)
MLTLQKQKEILFYKRAKYIRKNELPEDHLTQHPEEFPNPIVSVGFCKKKELVESQLDEEIEALKEKLKEFESNLAPGTEQDLFIGKAFIVFETPEQAQLVQSYYEKSIFARMYNFVACCCEKREDSLEEAIFFRAPEPTDVFWEQLNVSKPKKCRRTTETYAITFLLLGCDLGIIYGLNKWKDQYKDAENEYRDIVIGLAISMVISLINKLLAIVVKNVSFREHNET